MKVEAYWRALFRCLIFAYWIALALICLWTWILAFKEMPEGVGIFVDLHGEAHIELFIHILFISLTFIYVVMERKEILNYLVWGNTEGI